MIWIAAGYILMSTDRRKKLHRLFVLLISDMEIEDLQSQGFETSFLPFIQTGGTGTHLWALLVAHKWPNMAKMAIYGHLAIGPCAIRPLRVVFFYFESSSSKKSEYRVE